MWDQPIITWETYRLYLIEITLFDKNQTIKKKLNDIIRSFRENLKHQQEKKNVTPRRKTNITIDDDL